MQMRRSWWSVPAGLVGVATAASLGACGSGSGGGSTQTLSPVAAVQAAYATTIQSRTARIALNEHVTTAGQSVDITGSGGVDFGSKATSLTITVEGQTVEVRSLGTVEYVRLPASEQAELGGKTWLKVDLATISPQLAQQVSSGNSDPTQGLSLLKNKARSVTKVGTETIRGASTTHYRAALDLASVVKGYPATTQRQIRTVFGDRTTINEDVWIDGQGRVRRVLLPASQSGGTVEATVDLYDFGASVDVSPPPAAETGDGNALLGKSLGG